MNTRWWDDVTVGDPLPAVELDVTALKAASVPAVTLDTFAAHYDTEAARSLGLDALSMNTMQLIGLANRHATDWAGPGAFIMNYDVKFVRPAYLGYRLTVSGDVARVWDNPHDPVRTGCVETTFVTTAGDGTEIVKGTMTLALPRRQVAAT